MITIAFCIPILLFRLRIMVIVAIAVNVLMVKVLFLSFLGLRTLNMFGRATTIKIGSIGQGLSLVLFYKKDLEIQLDPDRVK